MNAPTTSPDAGARQPRWRALVVLLAALASVAVTARLGVWQLDRARQKLALQASMDARAREPALDASMLARTPEGVRAQEHRAVVLHGRWLPDRTVFLDNRQMDGRVGFFVVTPLALTDATGAVVVQRGWAPRNFAAREVLPRVETPVGPVTVVGSVAAQPSRLFEFAGAASGPIRQNLDVSAFARETGLPLLPLAIVQRDDAGTPADGLVRHWQPPATNVQTNYGYAAQWFAMAAAIVFLYVWYRFIRPGKS